MVAHACRQLEWHHTIHHVVHERFRFVGMWRVLEPALASISLERIGRPFADIDATHKNGRGYVRGAFNGAVNASHVTATTKRW